MKDRLLFIVNVDWFFISHRLPIAIEALKKGYEVHIATTISNDAHKLEDYGFVVHPIKLERGKSNIFLSIISIFQIFNIIKKIRPSILHLITIKPILYGGIVARFLKVPFVVVSISGLGFIFLEKSFFGKIRKFFVKILYKIALKNKNIFGIFQNKDDRNDICNISGLSLNNTFLITGSGVSLSDFSFKKYQDKNIPSVLMAARLLVDKGVHEYVEAAKILKKNFFNIRFVLAGAVDFDNPSSISTSLLNQWIYNGYIEHVGFQNDMQNLLESSSIAILPSYREGLPKFLIEASAVGRAIITTDVPGCRDAIIEGKTGLLVPVKDPVSLANAIKFLISDKHLMINMGIEGRKYAEKNFDIRDVINKHMDIYQMSLKKK